MQWGHSDQCYEGQQSNVITVITRKKHYVTLAWSIITISSALHFAEIQ